MKRRFHALRRPLVPQTGAEHRWSGARWAPHRMAHGLKGRSMQRNSFCDAEGNRSREKTSEQGAHAAIFRKLAAFHE